MKLFYRSSKWIDVEDINPPIYLQTFNCCMTLADVHGDNDHKFVVVDFGSGSSSPQLKVWVVIFTYKNVYQVYVYAKHVSVY